jgi:hypothetical protein
VAEAPAVEQFAQQHQSEVTVVGLGTQDDFAYAQQFRERTGVTHQLLWDESFDSWAELGVASQPSSILFAADGSELRRWSGLFDADEVLRLVSTSGAATKSAPTSQAEIVGAAPALNADQDRFCRYASRFDSAQRQMEAVFQGDSDAVSAMADDVAFSANGMAQFSPPTLRAVTAPLSRAAVRLRSQLRTEEPSSLKRSGIMLDYLAAAGGLVDPAKQTCDLEIRIASLG